MARSLRETMQRNPHGNAEKFSYNCLFSGESALILIHVEKTSTSFWFCAVSSPSKMLKGIKGKYDAGQPPRQMAEIPKKEIASFGMLNIKCLTDQVGP